MAELRSPMIERKQPHITVIIAVLNGVTNLQRCIDSVSDQIYPHWEIIVIDGGSSDGTIDILTANSQKIAYWESEADSGIYHAWNKGLSHANGDWICFLGADDYLWGENVLADFVPHLIRAYPSHRVVYGNVAVVSGHGETLALIEQPWEKASRRFFVAMSIPHPGTMHHRAIFDDLGGFDESFRMAGDYDLLLRELRCRAPCYVPDIIQAAWQEGGVTTHFPFLLRSVSERRKALNNNAVRLSPSRVIWMYVEETTRLLLKIVFGERVMRHVQRRYREMSQRS